MEKVKSYKNKELLNPDFEAAPLPKLRDDFIAKLENALMFLGYKDLSMFHSDATQECRLSEFDGAWLIDVSLRHDNNEAFMLIPYGEDQVTPDMFPNMNLKKLNLSGEIGHLSKCRFLQTKEKRHLRNYRFAYSQKNAFLDYGKQKWWTDSSGYGFNKKITKGGDSVFMPIPMSLKNGYYVKTSDALNWIQSCIKDNKIDQNGPYWFDLQNLHLSLQLSLTYYYEWSCYIKETPDSLGVRIPIHPSSSKEIFMMRNIPEGHQRKKAICNYVKGHYRTIKGNGNERKALVKKHFRGDLKFNWRGLQVHITPSQYDLNRIKTKKKFLDFDKLDYNQNK